MTLKGQGLLPVVKILFLFGITWSTPKHFHIENPICLKWMLMIVFQHFIAFVTFWKQDTLLVPNATKPTKRFIVKMP